MPKKEVILITYGAMSKYPDAESYWEDVWIEFKHKRKKKYFGPTLCSKADAEGELSLHKQIMEENLDLDWAKQDVLNSQDLLQALAQQDIVIEDSADVHCPWIYTSKETINREEAERMIRYFLSSLGFNDVRLKWKKNKSNFFVHSVSVGQLK